LDLELIKTRAFKSGMCCFITGRKDNVMMDSKKNSLKPGKLKNQVGDHKQRL